MAQKIEISVVISAYNQEKYIGRCLRLLINQKIESSKFEIILINDGSADRTLFAAELFCDPNNSKIRTINNKINIGLPASLKKSYKYS